MDFQSTEQKQKLGSPSFENRNDDLFQDKKPIEQSSVCLPKQMPCMYTLIPLGNNAVYDYALEISALLTIVNCIKKRRLILISNKNGRYFRQ